MIRKLRLGDLLIALVLGILLTILADGSVEQFSPIANGFGKNPFVARPEVKSVFHNDCRRFPPGDYYA